MGTASGIIVLIIDPISGFSPLFRMESERFAVGQYRPYGTGQLPHRCCGRLPIGHPFPFGIEELIFRGFREDQGHNQGRRPACEEVPCECGHEPFDQMSGMRCIEVLQCKTGTDALLEGGHSSYAEADLCHMGDTDLPRTVQVPSGQED